MWGILEQINWAKRSQDYRGYNQCKVYLLEMYTQEGCNAIRKFAEDRKAELYKRVTEYQKENNYRCGDYSGDDSFGDLLWHVVGLGEKAFNMIMENPKLLDRVKYVECFAYCLPYDSDFLEDDLRELADAKELIRALVATIQEDGQGELDVVTDALDFLRK